MQRILFLLLLAVVPMYPSAGGGEASTDISDCERLYSELGVESVVRFTAFEQAYAGYYRIEERKKPVMTVIDFSKPSTEERLCVVDMKRRKVLFTSHVAHGRNSGGNYATSFSNESGSWKSSLGFYITKNTYQGRNGYSLVLEGLEQGVNDKARERAIVIHGAAYANPSAIPGMGRLGRSFGCPALPTSLNQPIIDAIKDGAVLFIYADDPGYLSQSALAQHYRPVPESRDSLRESRM